ncbi:transposase [Corynebacterium belfantii]|uniref:IS3 family transposase n=1 Tax=Corynebacterium belfantii TaxID=2014537 RepID=UPI0018D405F8|nr:transposase [Corynebacterium belfantii]MBG9328471.1 transposase [Corynebacterium belfantii]
MRCPHLGKSLRSRIGYLDRFGHSPINHKKVARIMKSMGLKDFTKRRRGQLEQQR